MKFIAYLDGFSPNVQEILSKLEVRNQINRMIDANILSTVTEKSVSPTVNLRINPVLDDKGKVTLPRDNNHTTIIISEELIRKFNEENNVEVREDFTQRDVLVLMVDMTILPVVDKLRDGSYHVYEIIMQSLIQFNDNRRSFSLAG